MKSFILILCYIALVVAKITIHGPKALKEKFKDSDYTIDVVYSNYGRIPYGQSVIGRLQYNNTYSTGCKRDESLVSKFEAAGPLEAPVMMVERGDCHFVTKTRNIARAGGKVAIIIDTKNEKIDNVVMSDDGTGLGIGIPSVLIGNRDGQILKDFMKTANVTEMRQIVLNIEFNLPQKTKIVEVEYWYSQASEGSMRFLKNMGEFVGPILGDIKFSPSFVTWACPSCDAEFKKEHCLSDGKYCASHMAQAMLKFKMTKTKDRNMPHDNQVNGRDLLLENLRQHCLIDQLARKNRKADFFKYIEDVDELCGSRVTAHCSQQGMKGISIDNSAIEECVANTFEVGKEEQEAGSGDNRVYSAMAKRWKKHGTMLTPSVFINGVVFRGQKNPDNVFEAICAGFEEMPVGCTKWLEKEGIAAKHVGISTTALLFIIGAVIFVNLIIALVYKNYLQKEIQSDMKVQVSSAVSQYVALSQIKELDGQGETTLSAIQK